MSRDQTGTQRTWEVTLLPTGTFEEERFNFRMAPHDDRVIMLHDYESVYSVPGLYEHVVQELLACRSPQVAAEAVSAASRRTGTKACDLRVLDMGAGNGVSGEWLSRQGVERMVAIDSLEEARLACVRDRPRLYESYEVAESQAELADALGRLRWFEPNVLSCVGALGGGHIPQDALVSAIASLVPPGIVVLTIAERWLGEGGAISFCAKISAMLGERRMVMLFASRFIHRVDTSDSPIVYQVIAAKS